MTYKCTDCSNCLLEDFGYSNWTVEGTYVHCMKNLHPESPFDHWYGEDKRLNFANECESFVKGELESIAVDGDEFEDLSDEAKRYLRC